MPCFRLCGSLLLCGDLCSGSGGNPTTAATVFTAKQPFLVGVNFDSGEQDETDGREWSTGFNIYYSQTQC